MKIVQIDVDAFMISFDAYLDPTCSNFLERNPKEIEEEIPLLPENIYEAHLTSINGVKFTPREVDVIACYLNGRSKRKEIARFLSISENTVRTHVQNIRAKIGNDHIINFVEKGPQYLLLKNYYYASLRLYLVFEETLGRIAKIKHKHSVKPIVVYWYTPQQRDILLCHLAKHLLLTGVAFHLKERKLPITLEGIQNINTDSILLSKREGSEFFPVPLVECIEFKEQLPYYFLVFEVLKKRIPEAYLRRHLSEFRKSYAQLQQPPLPSTSSKKRYSPFIILGCILIICIAFLFKEKRVETQSMQPTITPLTPNSDRSIPTDSTLPKKAVLIENLPRFNEYFTGREEVLAKLTRLLSKQNSLVVLAGFPGVGKSQIARRFAEENRDHYDIIWRIDAIKDIINQLKNLAIQLNASNLLSESQKISADSQPGVFLEKIHSFLTTSPHKWLLIFDNVQNRGDVLDFLPPKTTHRVGNILITTRNRAGWLNVLKIRTFSQQESLELLKKITDSKQEESLKTLGNLLHHHPLSLVQAACYIRKYRVSIEEYINLFLNRRKELWEKERILLQKDPDIKDIHDNYEMTAETVLRLSLEKLQTQSPLGLKLLFFCSFWHNNKIPEDLLQDFLKFLGHDSVFNYHNILEELTKLSLLEREDFQGEEGAHNNTFSMHDLVPLVLQDMHSLEEKRQAIKLNLEFFDSVLKGGWDKITQVLAHAPHILSHIETLCHFAETHQVYEALLIALKTHILEYHMYHTRDQASYEKLIEDIEALLSKMTAIPLVIRARFYSDRVYSRAIYQEDKQHYKEEVERGYEKAIEIFQNAPQQENELFRGYQNFAQYFLFQGNFEQALAYVTQAEALLPAIKSTTYKNLFYFVKAWILCEKGDYALAQNAINNAIPGISQEKNVALQIYVQNMKAWADLKMGDYEGAYRWAQETHQKALNFFDKKNNDAIAWSTLIRGVYKHEKEDYPGAEAAFKESLERLESYYGAPDQHADQAYALTWLGNVYAKRGSLLEAKKSYETAEKIFNRLYSKKQGDVLRELYTRFAMLGAYLKDTPLATHYFNLHAEYFGDDTKGTQEILKVFQEQKIN